jgi:hypothetical protein
MPDEQYEFNDVKRMPPVLSSLRSAVGMDHQKDCTAVLSRKPYNDESSKKRRTFAWV